MKTVLQKWGNSLALRIPRTVAAEIAVGPGHAVDVQVNKGRIVIAPVTKKHYELSELVSGMTARNRHIKVDSGKPRGRESWSTPARYMPERGEVVCLEFDPQRVTSRRDIAPRLSSRRAFPWRVWTIKQGGRAAVGATARLSERE